MMIPLGIVAGDVYAIEIHSPTGSVPIALVKLERGGITYHIRLDLGKVMWVDQIPGSDDETMEELAEEIASLL